MIFVDLQRPVTIESIFIRIPTEEQIRKKEEKSNLELTFISNKLSSIIEIRRNSF
jgi:hypothetical protein